MWDGEVSRRHAIASDVTLLFKTPWSVFHFHSSLRLLSFSVLYLFFFSTTFLHFFPTVLSLSHTLSLCCFLFTPLHLISLSYQQLLLCQNEAKFNTSTHGEEIAVFCPSAPTAFLHLFIFKCNGLILRRFTSTSNNLSTYLMTKPQKQQVLMGRLYNIDMLPHAEGTTQCVHTGSQIQPEIAHLTYELMRKSPHLIGYIFAPLISPFSSTIESNKDPRK